LFSDQSPFAVRFEWGVRGLESVAAGCRVIVVVDVLSFSTSVDVAAARGAIVYPYRYRDESAARFAAEHQAALAGPHRSTSGYSLSPASLLTISAGTRLVLPSPNGATLSLRAAEFGATVIAGCLRNATAAAERISECDGPVAFIACGERWPDDTLRFAWEDLVGCGAIIARLSERRFGRCSPEAEAARAAFEQARGDLGTLIHHCASGRELIERGFAADVAIAAALDAGAVAAQYVDGRFVGAASACGDAAPPS
jgi:2-phosphosulfolactate phosphatase